MASSAPTDIAAPATPARYTASVPGFARLVLNGPLFLPQYARPNVLFHLRMVYALLRQQGLPRRRGDFEGWHVYAQTGQAS